ncbi:MAG: putative toxin-antitoxin system toxin component, PIN family [Candidatus Marinimicrobia bacterium CG_4_10_14_0_2_um_filter_48_9]|nr:MAG: putative toxin-antitoxin system toxin component, PIN family [Candidatus Marinimicrobia bacterium CG_4_10_14_0_2_um_filter_48_9]
MRVFLDTNVLVSAVATRGICADIFREVLSTHTLVTSEALFGEVRRILDQKLKVPQKTVTEFILLLSENSKSTNSAGTSLKISIDIRDQDDVTILNSALDGGAEIFITGDKEILTLHQVQAMRIISPRQFWELIKD